ncbi:hypothetical protein [Phaffia rhodozyma]|uniref:Uncharacterized protein n=1 Tax=Phaffia rhodozyma TaxID=264483 RepID=A0A0F7SJT3_PHARH|nr:hypothetical protein [Phaffia rhodozyma]
MPVPVSVACVALPRLFPFPGFALSLPSIASVAFASLPLSSPPALVPLSL